jgi:hypothetical protein
MTPGPQGPKQGPTRGSLLGPLLAMPTPTPSPWGCAWLPHTFLPHPPPLHTHIHPEVPEDVWFAHRRPREDWPRPLQANKLCLPLEQAELCKSGFQLKGKLPGFEERPPARETMAVLGYFLQWLGWRRTPGAACNPSSGVPHWPLVFRP